MNIRFKELVKTAGRPEEKSLWTDPKKDRGFQKAVKENRVVTIVQQPATKKKEFGEIGFHEQRYATYLVFPKPLPKQADARVIGIDYGLITQPEVRDAIDSSKIQPARPVKAASGKNKPSKTAPPPLEKAESPKRKPLRRFEVLLRRVAVLETTVSVEAKNTADAKKNAIANARKEPFDLSRAVSRMEIIATKTAD